MAKVIEASEDDMFRTVYDYDPDTQILDISVYQNDDLIVNETVTEKERVEGILKILGIQ